MDGEGMHPAIRQNAHAFAANRKGIFIMIAPADEERSPAAILDSYAVGGVIGDVFMEDKAEGDGKTLRTGDRGTNKGRALIGMVSTIMKVGMIRRISEMADSKKIKPADNHRNIAKRTPRAFWLP